MPVAKSDHQIAIGNLLEESGVEFAQLPERVTCDLKLTLNRGLT
ncbi:MAG: hypothetical protein WB646_15980 [Steroidobacteraceae bacterium]